MDTLKLKNNVPKFKFLGHFSNNLFLDTLN